MVLLVIGICAVVVFEGGVVGNWRFTRCLRTVARELECTKAFREAYGPGASITLSEGGITASPCLHGRMHNNTPFVVESGGTNRTIHVKWSNRGGGRDVRVHEFTEEYTPYTNFPPALE